MGVTQKQEWCSYLSGAKCLDKVENQNDDDAHGQMMRDQIPDCMKLNYK